MSSVYSEYHSLAVCPNCGFQFKAPRHGLKGQGAHYVIPALNNQHKLILFVLAQHSGGLTLNEVYRCIIEYCNEHHLPYVTKGSVAGRLSEMAAISLVREIEVLGKWYYSITEDGRKVVAEAPAALWRFDNIEEGPPKNSNITNAEEEKMK